jgi:ParB family transcriptional regulator, chromosome partitioning protein
MAITTTPSPKVKLRGLGRGLAAILETEPASEISGFIANLPIDQIQPNPHQPRATIKPEDIIGLADSIREYGVIEPLIVANSHEAPAGHYQLVAGERRWRAAKLAQLKTIPVIVKDLSNQQLLELAIIENIQRKDLNPIEEATALSMLYTKYRIKLEDLAKKVGKEASTISNKMRLLKLPKPVQQGMLEDKITEGHAYVLLSLKSTDALLAAYNIIVRKKFSVRQTEELVRKISLANKEVLPVCQKQNAVIYDEKTVEIQNNLGTRLGKGFRLIRKKNGGRIVIPFSGDEQLEKLYKYLMSKEFLGKE